MKYKLFIIEYNGKRLPVYAGTDLVDCIIQACEVCVNVYKIKDHAFLMQHLKYTEVSEKLANESNAIVQLIRDNVSHET